MDGLPYGGIARFVRPDPQGTLFDLDPEEMAEC
jgi:hypothetical protein